MFINNFSKDSVSKEERKNFQLIYRISLILTLIGSVILLFVVFESDFELGKIDNLWIIGGILVLIGLVVIPIVAWLWMFKKEKN